MIFSPPKYSFDSVRKVWLIMFYIREAWYSFNRQTDSKSEDINVSEKQTCAALRVAFAVFVEYSPPPRTVAP